MASKKNIERFRGVLLLLMSVTSISGAAFAGAGARPIYNADQCLASRPRSKDKEDYGHEPYSLQQSLRIRCLCISKHMP